VDLADLQSAWLLLIQRARLNSHHRIQREELSVREYMTDILRRLQADADDSGEERDQPFERLFSMEYGVSSLIVGFLAVLELVKERLVLITQMAPMESIYVRLNPVTA
jgi:segregation and condensation protein A